MDRSAMALALGVFVLGACGGSSTPKAGDACSGGDGTGDCNGASAALLCVNSVLVATTCAGPSGCTSTSGAFACDQSVANIGDACVFTGYACASNKQAAIVCTSGKFVADASCDGPGGCSLATAAGGKFLCDTTIANMGDPCDPSFASGSCGPGGTSSMACDANVWTGTACTAGTSCSCVAQANGTTGCGCM